MTERSNRAPRHYVFGLAMVLALAACGDAVELPNRTPSASAVQSPVLSPSGQSVAIYYELADLDGDDLAVTVEYCDGDECAPITTAIGGDGLANLPTIPDGTVVHQARWDAACDVTEGQYGTDFRVRVTPRDAENTGFAVYGPRFTLDDLSFVGTCGGEADALEASNTAN